MIGAAAVSAVSTYQQSRAQRSQLEQQAAIDEQNAVAADYQKTDAMRRGQETEAMHMLQVGQNRARQEAALAANGVVTTEGSAFGLLADTELFGAIDASTIRDNTAREAYGYSEQARQLRVGAAASRSAGRSINPGFSAFSSLAGSAGQYAASSYFAGQARAS